MGQWTNGTTDDEVLDEAGVVADAGTRALIIERFEQEVEVATATGGALDRQDVLRWWLRGIAIDGWFSTGEAPGRFEAGVQPGTLEQRARALRGQDPSPVFGRGVRGVGAVDEDPRGLADHR